MNAPREWVRPTERPEWGRDDVEWWWTPSDEMRVLAEDEWGRKCSVPRCRNLAVLVWLDRVTPWRREPYVRRRFKCVEHTYGDYVIEDGRILVKQPRLDLLEQLS